MSTGFELPGESEPEEARPTFGSVRRGYDPEQVDTFITQVAGAVKVLRQRLREPAVEVSEEVEERLEKRFAKILAVQEREAQALLKEAHDEASRLVVEAKEEADHLLEEQRANAERVDREADALRAKATEEADRLRADVVAERDELGERFPEIRRQILSFLDDIEDALGTLGDPAMYGSAEDAE